MRFYAGPIIMGILVPRDIRLDFGGAAQARAPNN